MRSPMQRSHQCSKYAKIYMERIKKYTSEKSIPHYPSEVTIHVTTLLNHSLLIKRKSNAYQKRNKFSSGNLFKKFGEIAGLKSIYSRMSIGKS